MNSDDLSQTDSDQKQTEVVEVISNSESPKKRQLSYKEKKEFEEIEKTLPLLEKEKQELSAKLTEANLEYTEIEKISARLTAVTTELEGKEMRWLEISELLG